MKLDIFNIDEFIKINNLQPVTSPVGLMSANMPNPNGIYSYEIFGYTTEERKNNFAYINLHGNFFHPQCIKTLNRMGSLGKILSRDKRAIVMPDGKIHILKENEDFSDAETGIEFFYDNWEKIKWNKNSVLTTDKTINDDELSIDKRNRLKFFNDLKKDEVFVRNWLVVPAYYRDFSADNVSMGDDINKLYTELISRSNSLQTGFGFSSFGDVAKDRIQQLLILLYDSTLGPVTGKSVDLKETSTFKASKYNDSAALKGNTKTSIIRRNILGRFLDFSASSVITSPLSSTTETEDDFAKFGTVKLPLQTFMAMAKPFFLNYCTDVLTRMANFIRADCARYGKINKFDSAQWSVSEIDKSVTRFIKTASEKDVPISFEITVDNAVQNVYVTMAVSDSKNPDKFITRPMTYLDLFYIAGYEIAKDKYALDTRYPVTNNQNIYPAKIVLNSTNKTKLQYVKLPVSDEIIEYKHYPYVSYDKISKIDFDSESNGDYIVDPDPKPAMYYDLFRATIIGNGCIKSLAADYDGDVLFFRCLFTKEANAEAEKLIWKKTNWFSADGNLSRGITKIDKDCILSLYQLTKN